MPPRPRPSRKQRKNDLQFQVVRDENGEVALRCLNPPKGVRTREQLLPFVSPNIPLDMIEDNRRQTRFSRETTLQDDQDSALVERLLQNISLEDLDFGDNGHDDFDAYDNFDDNDIDVIDMHELEATEHDAHSQRNHKLFGAQSNADAYTYDYNKHFRPFSENGAFVVPGVGITSDPQANQPIVPAAPDVDDTYEEDLKTDAGLQKRQKKIQSKVKGTILSTASGLELPVFESSRYKFTDDFLAPLESGETELYEEIEDNIFELLLGNSDDDGNNEDDGEQTESLSREDVLRQLQSQNEEVEGPISIVGISSGKEQGPMQPKGKKGVKFANDVTTTSTTQSKSKASIIYGSSLGAWSDEENDDESNADDLFGYDNDDFDDAYDEDDLDEDDEELDQDAQVDREIMSRMKQRLMKNYKPEEGVSIEIEEGGLDEDDFADGEGEFEDLSWYFENQQEGDYDEDDEGRNIYEDDDDAEFAPIENDPFYKGAMLVQFNKLMDEYENDNSTDDDEFERPYDEDDAELQFHINKDGVSIDDQGVRTAIAEFDGRNRNTQFNYRNASKIIAPEVTQYTKDWVDSQQNTPQPSLAQVEKDIDRQFAKKKKERLDVQSMRTTLSTTANIPTLIKEVRVRAQPKVQSQKRSVAPLATVAKKGNVMDADYVATPIKLDAMGVPLGIMEKHRQDRKDKGAAKVAAFTAQQLDSQLDEDQEDDEDDEDDGADDEEYIPGMTRSKKESVEERAARKAAQKEFKRSRRTEKKQTKGIFKTETKKQKDLEYQIKHHNPGFKKLL